MDAANEATSAHATFSSQASGSLAPSKARELIYIDTGLVWNRLTDVTVQRTVLLAVIAIPLTHFLLHRLVFTPAAQALLPRHVHPKKTDAPTSEDASASDVDLAYAKRLTKFQESAWKFCAYTVLTLVSGYALSRETFWKSPPLLWTDCDSIPCKYDAPLPLRNAYSADMAYYMYAIPYAIYFETKRKDFAATLLHHLVTVALIVYSYALGLVKVGVLIMFLHDICDAPLEIAKLAKYAGREVLTNVVFVLFTLLWIVMRVVYFPAVVIRSAIWDAHVAFLSDRYYTRIPHHEMLAGMLVILWILHVYWTYVILRIAVAAVSSGSASDEREDEN